MTRSGLAWKNFIDTGAGVIDYDYRGNVGVVLFNHAETDFVVSKGDRIAQLILVSPRFSFLFKLFFTL
jgi:dUTP pyrophosphatase